MFQFHFGTIDSQFFQGAYGSPAMFQFHFGTIDSFVFYAGLP